MKNILLTIILSFAYNPFLKADEVLFSINRDNTNIELRHARSRRELILLFTHIQSKNIFDKKVISVKDLNRAEVDSSEIISELKSHKANANDIERVRTILEEFKLASTLNYQAIHLGEEIEASKKIIDDFDLVSSEIKGRGNFERSLALHDFEVPDLGKLQLRILVDAQKKPIKLSLVRFNKKSLKGVRMVRQQDAFDFYNEKGLFVFSFEKS